MHFHQLSRLFELKILISGNQNKPLSHTAAIVQKMLTILPTYSIDHQKWFISRVIKALAFTNRFNFTLHNSEFKEKIIQYYFQNAGKVTDVAELINQLASRLIIDEPSKLYPLQKVNGNPINETNTRITVESATAYLYAKEPVKQIIDKNLQSFAQQTGNSWIISLLTLNENTNKKIN